MRSYLSIPTWRLDLVTWLRPFDNTTSGYKEWRKRIQLYARRMAIQKRESEIGISVLSTLTGAAWGQCEDLEVKDLETADGLGRTLDRLDAQWQYDEKIEVPEAFKKYFYKTYRAMNQTILDHCAQAGQAFRKLSKYKISLPDEAAFLACKVQQHAWSMEVRPCPLC